MEALQIFENAVMSSPFSTKKCPTIVSQLHLFYTYVDMKYSGMCYMCTPYSVI